MSIVLPDLPPDSLVAVDTETSGLFVDDGARVSIVSIAYYPDGKTPVTRDGHWDLSNQPETALFAFDQGRYTPLGPKQIPTGGGKKNRLHQESLFDQEIDAAPNLNPGDYMILMTWLAQHSLVFHNAKFDLHILQTGLRGFEEQARFFPDLSRCVHWDTQVVNPVLWPMFKTSLKPTAERLFGVGEADLQRQLQVWLKKNAYRFDLAPWPMVGPYAAQDAALTLRLYDAQLMDIESGSAGDPQEILVVAEREIDLAITLYRMERRGIGFDAEWCLEEAEKLAAMVAQAEVELTRAVRDYMSSRGVPDDVPVPPITEHVMRHLWFGKDAGYRFPGMGLMPVQTTEKGEPSVAAEVVRELAKRGMPCADEYDRLNKLETALSMWYGNWPKMVGDPAPEHHPELEGKRWPRLRTNYRQSRTLSDGRGGTVSGRLAVERVQMQAVPQDYQIPLGIEPIRRFFKPDPGYALWEMDLSQAEFRVAAGISKCRKMIESIAAGDWDAHDSTTELMFNVTKDHPDWKYLRQVAKRLNFGMLYGAGAETIRRQIEQYTGQYPPLEQMQAWLDKFRNTFPELGWAARAAQRQVERTRELKLAGGRTRWFGPFEQEHKAFNQLIQGGVAEMMKVSMIEIEANFPGIQLLQIHDSITVEIPKRDIEIVDACQKIMCDTFTAEFGVPFVSDAKEW